MALERKLWEVNEGSVSTHRVIAIKKMTTDVVMISFYGIFSLLIWSLQNSWWVSEPQLKKVLEAEVPWLRTSLWTPCSCCIVSNACIFQWVTAQQWKKILLFYPLIVASPEIRVSWKYANLMSLLSICRQLCVSLGGYRKIETLKK